MDKYPFQQFFPHSALYNRVVSLNQYGKNGGLPSFFYFAPPRMRVPHPCVLCKGGNLELMSQVGGIADTSEMEMPDDSP